MKALFDRRTRAIIRLDFKNSFSVADLAERYQCCPSTIVKVISNGYTEKDNLSQDAEFTAASSVKVLSDTDSSEDKSSGSETEMGWFVQPRAGPRKSSAQTNQVNASVNPSIPPIRLPKSTPGQGSVTSESSKKDRRDLNLDVLSAKVGTSSIRREKSTPAAADLDSGTTSTKKRVIDVDLDTFPETSQRVKRKVGSPSIRRANKVTVEPRSPALKRQRGDRGVPQPDGFESFLLKLGLPHLVAPFAKLGFSTEDDLKYMRGASVGMQREVMDKIHAESQVNLKEWMVILGALRESEY